MEQTGRPNANFMANVKVYVQRKSILDNGQKIKLNVFCEAVA